MKSTIAILVIFLLIFSSFSFAGTEVGPVSLQGKRLQIISTGTPRLYIYDLPIDSGCTQNIPVLILGGSEKNIIANELYSAILMAKASGKQVTIQTTGCWSGWSTPVITSMYIYD